MQQQYLRPRQHIPACLKWRVRLFKSDQFAFVGILRIAKFSYALILTPLYQLSTCSVSLSTNACTIHRLLIFFSHLQFSVFELILSACHSRYDSTCLLLNFYGFLAIVTWVFYLDHMKIFLLVYILKRCYLREAPPI